MNRLRKFLLTMASGGAAPWTPAAPLSGGGTPSVWVKSDTGTYTDAAKSVAAADDGLVYTWANLVTGNDFVQATEARRPLLKIVSGAHYIRTDGSDDYLSVTISADASQTWFIVAKKNSALGAPTKTLCGGNNTNCQIYTDFNTGTGFDYYATQAGAEVAGGGSPLSLTRICFTLTSAASATLYVDDNNGIAFDPNDVASTITAIQIGAAGAATPGDYDILEFIQYTSALSDADRATVMTYLTGRVANPT
jgi:hypothetical protein